MKKSSIVGDLPDVPPFTPERAKELLEEGKKFADLLAPRIRRMQNLTAEDWASKVK